MAVAKNQRARLPLKSSAGGAQMPRPPKGERTRESILHVAVNLASVEGLEGVSIGRLADELGMSKSGLFAHFGSKEDLQLATVDMAREIFIEHVVRPAVAQAEGMPRLRALCDNWLGHVEQRVFMGGCFFTAASFEFDSRPGPVRDRIVTVMKEWLNALSQAVEGAKRAGHIKGSVDPRQLAFEIYSLAIGAHWGFQLLGDRRALKNARSTILARIRALATRKCPPLRQDSSR
ncbi:MAG TPA: TetR/AcrR family transcriptional regulator [Candidatus Angelobacter sp.]|nr:TetR/AcrR family transcriptional regulator [Candidatus Angelobacter sp.]